MLYLCAISIVLATTTLKPNQFGFAILKADIETCKGMSLRHERTVVQTRVEYF